jgi:hypothetical protein
MPEARWNPGADSLGSKRSSRLSRSKRFERIELLGVKAIDFVAEGLRLALSVDRNCGIQI